MTTVLPKATHSGDLQIGNVNIQCAVLEDGTRVLTRASFLKAIGRTGKAKGGRGYDDEFKTPVFLTAKNLAPYIPEKLIENAKPVIFNSVNGRQSIGYRAELLPQVCGVFLDVDEDGKATVNQKHIVQKCKVLIRGFATIGIVALVDEATGYQKIREKDALQQILDKFLKDNASKWAKTFPDTFWEKLIKIKGYPSYMALKRPSFVGHWVNDIVYDRIAPGVKAKLKKVNPRTDKGSRKHKHHQFFTDGHGVPELKDHLTKVITLIDASSNDGQFKRLLNRALPKYGDTIEMTFETDE